MEEQLEKILIITEDTNKKITELYNKMVEAENSQTEEILRKWAYFYLLSLGADNLLGINKPPSSFL